MEKYIGTTLVFALKENDVYKAVQESFILKLNDFLGLKEEVKSLVDELILTDYKGYEHLGISDLYMTEDERDANFLGRSSYFDDKNIEESRKHVLNEEQLKKAFANTKGFKKSNVGLVYFHQDEEGEDYNSTIIVYSQISGDRDLKFISEMADSISFKRKIIGFSVEQLYEKGLKFIGVSDLYPIKGKGLFRQSGEFKSLSNIKTELIPPNELEAEFKNVLEDYEYV